MSKGKTIKLAIDTGAYQLGAVPPETRVTIEAGWLFSKEARAPLDEAFKLEDPDAKNRAALERIARHVVVSWSVAQELDRDAVSAFLIALYEEEPLAAAQIINRLADRDRFARPSLVDPEDLGEG